MNKAIFIDLDQTTTTRFDKHNPSINNIHALKNAQKEGWYVVISTGRNKKDLLEVYKKIRFNELCDFSVHSGGMVIENLRTNELFKKEILIKRNVEELLKYIKDKNYLIKLSNDSTAYIDKLNFRAKIISKILKINIKKTDDMSIKWDSFSKLGLSPSFFSKKTFKIRNELDKRFNELDFVITGSKRYIEVTNLNQNKGNSIKELAKIIDLDLSKSIAIGDSMNDLEMFKVVGTPIVVKNGMKDLKKYAKYQTKSVEKDGVAEVIKKFVLKK